MTYVVIKILVAPRGGASGPPIPVSATGICILHIHNGVGRTFKSIITTSIVGLRYTGNNYRH